MPIQIPSMEKANFISLVQVAPYPGGPIEAARLESILVNYEDIPTAIYRQQDLFASNNSYLVQGLSCFNNSNLMSVGIWFQYNSSSPPLTDPQLIVNSDIDNDVIISAYSPPYYKTLAIMGPSNINRVVLLEGADLNELYIGPGATVGIVDSSRTGAIINVLWLPFAKNTPSTAKIAAYGSTIGYISKDEGSYFGGYSNINPKSTCSTAVSDLAYSIITHNTVGLTWTPPDQQSPPSVYLFINIYYRIKGSEVWLIADETTGLFNGDNGYTFTGLKCDTTYQFKVTVTCNNGGVADSQTLDIATTAAPC